MNQITLKTSISYTENLCEPAKKDLAYSESLVYPFGN